MLSSMQILASGSHEYSDIDDLCLIVSLTFLLNAHIEYGTPCQDIAIDS